MSREVRRRIPQLTERDSVRGPCGPGVIARRGSCRSPAEDVRVRYGHISRAPSGGWYDVTVEYISHLRASAYWCRRFTACVCDVYINVRNQEYASTCAQRAQSRGSTETRREAPIWSPLDLSTSPRESAPGAGAGPGGAPRAGPHGRLAGHAHGHGVRGRLDQGGAGPPGGRRGVVGPRCAVRVAFARRVLWTTAISGGGICAGGRSG